jgi:hypothetical protein
MGSHPLAALSPAERATYRTALTAHVLEAIYHAWQSRHTLELDEIVLAVQAARPGAETVEVHRAVAGIEYAGVIRPDSDPTGPWRLVDEPRRLPRPMAVCPRPECLRPAGHDDEHLPELRGEQFAAQLVINGGDFVAAWAAGSPWVQVYRNARDWDQDSDPVEILPVPHTMRYTPDALTDLITAWTSSDVHAAPSADNSDRRPFVYEPGVDNGTLIYRHADFFAVWDHDRREVWFYDCVVDWDDDIHNTIDRVPVHPDAPFTGAVLDQLCDDWTAHQTAKEHARRASAP